MYVPFVYIHHVKHNAYMKLSQFQFTLPQEKIATEPSYWRDECKMMVLNRKTGEDAAAFGNLGHTQTYDLVAGGFGNILTVEENSTVLLRDQTHNALHHGCLTGTVGTDQRDDFTFVNFKADALQRTDNTIVYFKIFNFQ